MGRLRTLVARRRILALLITRDLKVKYSDSTLGYLWTVLEPLLMGAVYWFVFTKIFPRGTIAQEPYIVFLLVALLPWTWASQVISASPRAIAGEARLVRSVDVPREIWVLRTVGSKFFEFVFSIPVVVFFMVVLTHGANWWVLLLPYAVGLQWVTLVGIALILAPVTVMMTDVERLIRIIVRMLFYMCPILYSANSVLENDRVPEIVKSLYELNPFTTILSMYRGALFHDEMPSFAVAVQGTVVGFALLGVGVWVFRKLEPAVLKEI
ncbi:MAG: ABC transporter permease [Sporichthyaceae bacterium]